VDIAAGAIETAVERSARAEVAAHFVRADLADLPFEDGTFDLVVSTISYHHWEQVPEVVAELARVLRRDGRLWVYDARLMAAGPLRDAVRRAMPDRSFTRMAVRAGWLPLSAFQRLVVSGRNDPDGSRVVEER
jgi:ubiquinone/menaquinone biosynthesis C-methylase UbiE